MCLCFNVSFQVLNAARCTVVAFDFSGSGMSEGEWVTLGYFEQHDVADVLAYLRSNGVCVCVCVFMCVCMYLLNCT